MKRLFLITGIAAILMSFCMTGDDCRQYFSTKPGEKRTYTQYDKSDKVTAVSTQEIISVVDSGGGLEINVGVTMKPVNSDSVMQNNFTVNCRDGAYSVSMDNFLDKSMLAPYEGMEIELESDRLDLPLQPYVGQKLKDGTITAKIKSQGSVILNLTVQVTNRQVAAMEDVVTPTGTYPCAKITYEVETRFAFIKAKSQGAEWYAKNVGLVKSATFDKNGKIDTYTLLTAVN